MTTLLVIVVIAAIFVFTWIQKGTKDAEKKREESAQYEIKMDLQKRYPEEYALWVMHALELEESELSLLRVTAAPNMFNEPEEEYIHNELEHRPAIIFKEDALDDWGDCVELKEFKAKHGLSPDARIDSLPLEQSDLDFLEAYRLQYPSIKEHEQRIHATVEFWRKIKNELAITKLEIEAKILNENINEEISERLFGGKEKEKSAAGSMVKGAIVGGLIGGDGGAVVGAMVAKEQHDHKNKDNK